jgi:hypothetical protein
MVDFHMWDNRLLAHLVRCVFISISTCLIILNGKQIVIVLGLGGVNTTLLAF